MQVFHNDEIKKIAAFLVSLIKSLIKKNRTRCAYIFYLARVKIQLVFKWIVFNSELVWWQYCHVDNTFVSWHYKIPRKKQNTLSPVATFPALGKFEQNYFSDLEFIIKMTKVFASKATSSFSSKMKLKWFDRKFVGHFVLNYRTW